MQFALSDPVTTTIDPQFRFIEDNGWPNVELRLAFSSGPLEQIGFEAIRPFETGVSAVVGQLRNTDLGRAQRNIALGPCCGLQMAIYRGLGYRWRVLYRRSTRNIQRCHPPELQ